MKYCAIIIRNVVTNLLTGRISNVCSVPDESGSALGEEDSGEAIIKGKQWSIDI